MRFSRQAIRLIPIVASTIGIREDVLYQWIACLDGYASKPHEDWDYHAPGTVLGAVNTAHTGSYMPGSTGFGLYSTATGGAQHATLLALHNPVYTFHGSEATFFEGRLSLFSQLMLAAECLRNAAFMHGNTIATAVYYAADNDAALTYYPPTADQLDIMFKWFTFTKFPFKDLTFSPTDPVF